MTSMANVPLNLGPVFEIAVKVHSAVERHGINSHKCHVHDDGSASRISQINRCQDCGAEVSGADLGTCVEQGDELLLLTVDELADAAAETSRSLVVQQTCYASEIQPHWLAGETYFLEPHDAKGSTRMTARYKALRNSLERRGYVAILQYTLRTSTHLAVLRPYGDYLMVQNLKWANELREPDFKIREEVEVESSLNEATDGQVDTELALFDPSNYIDMRTHNLAVLIEEKIAERERPAEPEPEKPARRSRKAA